LNDSTLSPVAKANQIADIPGFGFPTASGLVILLHPGDIAIMNKQTEGAFAKLGIDHRNFSEFQAAATHLRTELGADDYLELDWFLYEINNGIVEVYSSDLHEQMLVDIDRLIEDKILDATAETETEKKQLVNSRVGQGLFRSEVQRHENACRVTGVNDPDFLIASHIRPWRSSNNQERLDGENGLFLSPNIDRLFDKGYLSFDDDGTLLIANSANLNTLELLGVPAQANCGVFTEKQRHYLAYHRKHIFRDKLETSQ